jgi:hypothetical protein
MFLMKNRWSLAWVVVGCGGALSACGLAGTATGTATGAAAEAQQARDAKQIEAQAQQKLDDAQQAAAAQRDQAEKDAR